MFALLHKLLLHFCLTCYTFVCWSPCLRLMSSFFFCSTPFAPALTQVLAQVLAQRFFFPPFAQLPSLSFAEAFSSSTIPSLCLSPCSSFFPKFCSIFSMN